MKKFFKGIALEVRRSSEPIYLTLLTLFLISFQIKNIYFVSNIYGIGYWTRLYLNTGVMWFAGLYLALIILLWKPKWWAIPIAAGLIALVMYVSPNMELDLYRTTVGMFLAVMAYGKNWKRILKCYLWVTVAALVVALGAWAIGMATDRQRLTGDGHALGWIYPNNWTHTIFLVMVIIWYLYLQRKTLATFLMFWLSLAVVYGIARCRMTTAFVVVFPVFAWLLNVIRDREWKAWMRIAWNILMLAMPTLFFAFVLITAMNVEWLVSIRHIWQDSFWYRLVSNGVALQHYGIPLFPYVYISTYGNIISIFGDYRFVLSIMDSSFGTYMIELGAVWIAVVLAWLTLAHWKALRKKDTGILLISFFFLIMAVMERHGLNAWYNFVLLYPLAMLGNTPVVTVFLGKKKKEPQPQAALEQPSTGEAPETPEGMPQTTDDGARTESQL